VNHGRHRSTAAGAQAVCPRKEKFKVAAMSRNDQHRATARTPAAVAAFLVAAGRRRHHPGRLLLSITWSGCSPCPLCLEERIPYYVAIPLAIVVGDRGAARARRASRVQAGPRGDCDSPMLILVGMKASTTPASSGNSGRARPIARGRSPGLGKCRRPVAAHAERPLVIRCDEAAMAAVGDFARPATTRLISLALAAHRACGASGR